MTGRQPPIRLFVDLSDGISRTYDVTRYVIEAGVLRLFASPPGADDNGPAEVGPGGGDLPEIEVAAFAVGGWLRVERDLSGTHR
jgi:hypothetical protein